MSQAIATTETSNLRKLKISTDMRSVDKCLLAKMARKVEDLTLECVVQDVIWVFEAMAKFGTRKLNIAKGTTDPRVEFYLPK